jgi:hypothetical protein
MDDPYTKIPIGAQATVIDVDDIGSILCAWDMGSSLNVCYGADRAHKINTDAEAKITLDWWGQHQPEADCTCPRCGAPNEKKGMSKPLLITLICLTVVVVSLAVTFVTLMLRNKSGNPGTFDFTCSQYTEEMNRILGEEKLDQDKWVINDTSAEYNDTGFEIDLDIEEKSKHVRHCEP